MIINDDKSDKSQLFKSLTLRCVEKKRRKKYKKHETKKQNEV